MMDAFERLSQYRAGELSPEQMRALEAEPGFADRMQHLDALDAAVGALPAGLPAGDVEALVSRVQRPVPVARRAVPWLRVAVAALVLIAGGTAGWAHGTGRLTPWTIVPLGTVGFGPQSTFAPQTTRGGFGLFVPAGARAIVSGPSQTLWVVGEALVSAERGALRLRSGTAVVQGTNTVVELGGGAGALRVDGLVVVATEDGQVERLLATIDRDDLMRDGWMRLGTGLEPSLAVYVLEGTARFGPVAIHAGQKFLEKDAAVRPMARGQKVPMDARGAGAWKVPVTEERAVPPMPANTADHHGPLLETLAALARDGELRLRGPQLKGEPFEVPVEALRAIGGTRTVEQLIKRAWGDSVERTHLGLVTLYSQMGGTQVGLGNEALFGAIRDAATGEEFSQAVRQVAQERALLVPAGTDGTPITRAVRLLAEEDRRGIAALDHVLGEEKATLFVNHPSLGSLDHGFRVGPALRR